MLGKLRWHFYTVYYGLRNLIVWFKVIWRDDDCDWAFIYYILGFKLKRMAKFFKKYGHHVGSERDTHEMAIAAELCRRISLDDYQRLCVRGTPRLGPWLQWDSKKIKTNSWKEPPFMYDDYMIRQDLKFLHDLLTKKVRGWWN
jgi:hypothetical protein